MFLKIHPVDFVYEFQHSEYKSKYSRGALLELFRHLEDCESIAGEQELDQHWIVNTFKEYNSWDDFEVDYGDTLKRLDINTMDQLMEHTTVLSIPYNPNEPSGFIIEKF